MAIVQLLEFTGKGRPDETWHAADLLLFTKATRLEMNPELLVDIRGLPEIVKVRRLHEMSKTIPSSWEFVDLTFLITGVTRATAQQITRTRNASYAMQSQRVVDMSTGRVTNPFEPGDELSDLFEEASDEMMKRYSEMVGRGAAPQDARGILPLNVQTNLIAKYNLRAFIDLVRSRLSLRTQEEYAHIVHAMVRETRQVWPWVSLFLENTTDLAIEELEDAVKMVGLVTGSGPGWKIAKAIDLLRRG